MNKIENVNKFSRAIAFGNNQSFLNPIHADQTPGSRGDVDSHYLWSMPGE